PARERFDLAGRHRTPVLAPQQILEQDAERIGEARDRQPAPLECLERGKLERATPDLQRRRRPEAVRRRHSTAFTSTTKYCVSPKQVVGCPCSGDTTGPRGSPWSG